MASNKELRNSITAAAARKGVDAPETTDLTNVQLTAALRDVNDLPDAPVDGDKTLADKMFDAAVENNHAEPEAEQDDTLEALQAAQAAEAEPEPEPKVEAFPFSVAPGKALTSKRGMIAEGEEITAEDFPGGEDRLAELVKSGHVVKA